jgi:site-specific DNA-methyltransferase (adenine-specific)
MNSPAWKNKLYYGDNLDVLREYVNDESVDLVYLDPPFNSNATYNILFREKDGSLAASQLRAFGDTWEWDERASATYHEVVERGPTDVSDALQAFKTMLGPSNMLAYLSMMAPRLVELRRVLKPTGSLYLHCDPSASHYLKLLMDSIFGPDFFRNEIVWQRTNVHNDSKTWSRVSDTILFYTKGSTFTWNRPVAPHSEEHLASKYSNVDGKGRRYTQSDMSSPAPRPNMMYEWKGFKFPPNGWRYSKETMRQLDEEGRIWYPRTKDGALDLSKRPRLIRYLDEMCGTVMGNIWTDISPINSQAQERLGYPTQKPEALLERIIDASSNAGDTILDPFCGCGSAIAAAEGKRRWIGIDITQAAMVVIKQQRLSKISPSSYEIIGEPASVPDAEALAEQEPYQFQWWAVGKLCAHPVERKKGKDRGIDGRLDFHDDNRDTKHIMISVKAGHLLAQHVRELRGVMEREKAQIGVLVSRESPTKAMRAEAASAGFYTSPWRSKPYPRIQLLTIADLFSPNPIEMPGKEIAENISFKKGPHKERRRGVQGDFFKKQG